jgi:hypothetical protein
MSQATFHLINTDEIEQITPNEPHQPTTSADSDTATGANHSTKDSLLSIHSLDVTRLRQREEKSVNTARQKAGKIGVNVSRDAQLLFNELDRILPCQWDGPSIIVLEDIQLQPPYKVENVSPIARAQRAHAEGELQAAIHRIQQIITGLQNKKA